MNTDVERAPFTLATAGNTPILTIFVQSPLVYPVIASVE